MDLADDIGRIKVLQLLGKWKNEDVFRLLYRIKSFYESLLSGHSFFTFEVLYWYIADVDKAKLESENTLKALEIFEHDLTFQINNLLFSEI